MLSKLYSECINYMRFMSIHLLTTVSFKIKLLLKMAVRLGLALFIIVPSVNAEPTSGALLINTIRLAASGDVFVSVMSSAFCSTNTFVIPAGVVGRNQLVATLLIAQTNDKFVYFEADNVTHCNGWGTKLQSIYLPSQ